MSSVGNLVGESDDNVIITIGWKKAVVIKALKKRKVSFGYFLCVGRFVVFPQLVSWCLQ